jgi:hypothetical protein
MKAYGGVDVYIHVILASALVRGEWSVSRTGHTTVRETAPGTHRIGGWVGPRAGLDYLEKGKFLSLSGLELWPLVVQLVASRYTDWAIPVPVYMHTPIKLPLTIVILAKLILTQLRIASFGTWIFSHAHWSLLQGHILTQLNPVPILKPCFFKIHCNISPHLHLVIWSSVLPSKIWLRFIAYNCMHS